MDRDPLWYTRRVKEAIHTRLHRNNSGIRWKLKFQKLRCPGNLQNVFGNVRVAFGQIYGNLRKFSEYRQKRRYQYFHITGKINTWLLVKMEYLFL